MTPAERDAMREYIDAAVKAAIALHPARDGKDGAPGAPGEPGRDGKDGTAGRQGEPGERGEKGDPGADGAAGPQGEPGERGEQGEPGADGATGATGKRGEKGTDGRDGRDGKDGRDGITREEFDLALAAAEQRGAEKAIGSISVEDDGRTLKVGERSFALAVPLDQGVYRDDVSYVKGDCVTWAGSSWIATEPTSEKPGEGKTAWRLMTKRGRDGKDAT